MLLGHVVFFVFFVFLATSVAEPVTPAGVPEQRERFGARHFLISEYGFGCDTLNVPKDTGIVPILKCPVRRTLFHFMVFALSVEYVVRKSRGE